MFAVVGLGADLGKAENAEDDADMEEVTNVDGHEMDAGSENVTALHASDGRLCCMLCDLG